MAMLVAIAGDVLVTFPERAPLFAMPPNKAKIGRHDLVLLTNKEGFKPTLLPYPQKWLFPELHRYST
ncbi:hypothetical protein [uncultured Nitrospira sp.]|uniref:hypothetical protein n=1 Tax=uncultured Nitrospira sp. TaxID=157176 RepID=UPI003140C1E9